MCRYCGRFIRVWHCAVSPSDRTYDQNQRLSIGVHLLGSHSRARGARRRAVPASAAGGLGAGQLGGDQSQGPAESTAVIALLHSARNVAEWILLSALLDDDPG